MLPLQVEKDEHDGSSADVSTADRSRRHNVKRAHDGGEEGEGRKHDELHGWGVKEVLVFSVRERGGGTGQPRVFT